MATDEVKANFVKALLLHAFANRSCVKMASFIKACFSWNLKRYLSSCTAGNWSNTFLRDAVCSSSIFVASIQKREMSRYKRRTTHPQWYWPQRRHAFFDEHLTYDNRQFLREVINEKYQGKSNLESPLKDTSWPRGEWQPNSIRTGVIARKIGIYPMWTKDGRKLLTTLLQVLDNHVIRYVPPEVAINYRDGKRKYRGKYGLLIVGAEGADPQKFTVQYNGLFKEAGVMPKRKLTKFLVTPDAAIQPGTPLSISHFRVGDYVDVFGKTIGHGFQGVMKRWGMKGGPATHGTTKAHRRVGSIGTGRQMGRVWPGKKMPGHMGQERRTLLGLKIWRINTKYNVMWVQGPAVPGHVHHYVYIMDTRLPTRKFAAPPPFPTHYPEDDTEPLPEEILHQRLHSFSDPTILFDHLPDVAIPTLGAKARKIRR